MLIKAIDQPQATWRGGTTRAIYAYPADKLDHLAAAHLWIGTATIERDSPYSAFANRTRIHLPMRGNGLHLHFQQPTASIALATFAQTTFAGDRPLDVTLIDGSVEAFNLIFDPAVQADLQVLHLTAADGAVTLSPVATSPDQMTLAVQVLYVVNGGGTVENHDGEMIALQPGDAFVREAGNAIRVDCAERGGDLVVATLLWSPLV